MQEQDRDDIFPSPSERKEKEVQEYILYNTVEIVQYLRDDTGAYDLSGPIVMHYNPGDDLVVQYRNRMLPHIVRFLKEKIRDNVLDLIIAFYPALAIMRENGVTMRVLRRKDLQCRDCTYDKLRNMLSDILLYVPDPAEYTLAITPFDTDRIFSVLREQYSSVFPHAQRAWKPTQELLYTDKNAAIDRMYTVSFQELFWDRHPEKLVQQYGLTHAEIGTAEVEDMFDTLYAQMQRDIEKMQKEQQTKKTRGWKR